MAFFDEMKQRVSQVGQSASKSAREFSETSRLNSEISSAKNKINQLYNQIGYAVYCAYSTHPLPEAADLIAQVNELHGQIETYQAQIQAITASSHCPNCGAKIRPDMMFCSSCGAKLPQQEPAKPAAPAFCPSCGAPLAEGAMFCTSCGSRVTETPAPQPTFTAPVITPAPQPAHAENVCPGCGEPLPAGATFCINCGAKARLNVIAGRIIYFLESTLRRMTWRCQTHLRKIRLIWAFV